MTPVSASRMTSARTPVGSSAAASRGAEPTVTAAISPFPEHVSRSIVNPTRGPESAGNQRLILVAEDHPDSRDALRTLLEVHDFRVETANNGREAVEKAASVRPDLILMDIMMPEVDGFEATRLLRTKPEFDTVPILALTAMEGARELVLDAGCDDYLSKPIQVRTFLERVRSWLESGRTA